MKKAAIVSVLLILATGCAGAADDDTLTAEQDLSTVALGVDTNGATLDLGHAKSQGIGFVGRYVSFDGEHPALTAAEVQAYHQAGMPLIAIWEVGQDRAFEQQSLAEEHERGVEDATAAKVAMQQVGGAGRPIYFTVDYDITPELWKKTTTDTDTGKSIELGDLVLAYFEGIKSVIGVARSGAYGTYTTIHALFDQGLIKYGWQQTFGGHAKDPRDKRAQLRQYDIYPDQTGWGVAGAGALDLDRAVHPKFGQW